MKMNATIGSFWIKIPTAICLAAALWLTGSASLFAGSPAGNYADRISHVRLPGRPLSWVGTTPPSQSESQELWQALGIGQGKTFSETVGALAAFIKSHPHSPWTPSLHVKLAQYYQRNGYYTLALDHWRAAWAATKQMTDNKGRVVADDALVNYLQLLSRRGSPPLMRKLLNETKDRPLLPLFRMRYHQCYDAYEDAQNYPRLVNRCGAYALKAVSKVLAPASTFGLSWIHLPAPRTGFSLAQLAAMAKSEHLNMATVVRPAGQKDLVVPSVVHEMDHYVAIVARHGDRYKVVDPAFQEGSQWLCSAAINAQARGQFLVPASQIPAGWQSLSQSKAAHIFGKCVPFTPPPCPPNPTCPPCGGPRGGGPGGGGSGGGGSGGGGSGGGGSGGGSGPQPATMSCSSCAAAASGDSTGGMPTWLVREPWCDLCLVDEPLAYQPAVGPRISFKLTYSEQDGNDQAGNSYIQGNNDGLFYEDLDNGYNTFSLGNNWNCTWVSYAIPDTADSSYDKVTVYPPGGGERIYTNFDGTALNPYTNTRMLAETNSSGDTMGFKVLYPSGAQDVYEYIWQPESAGSSPFYFLTRQVDRQGSATSFYYTTNSAGTLLLKYVVDGDNKTNTLSYTNISVEGSSMVVLSQIADPYGHTVTLKYDSGYDYDTGYNALGTITNVTDVEGISSSFVYNYGSGVLTNLVTPYGTTTFDDFYYTYDQDDERQVVVVEPNGSHQMFLWLYNCASLPNSYTDPNNVPSYCPPDDPQGTNTLDNAGEMNARNSFYWGPKQFSNLSGQFLASSNWDYKLLTNSDYAIARLKHWNLTENGDQTHSLSMERDPSPDNGITPGEMTWYDYPGRPNYWTEGTSAFASLIIKVLPNGSEWYKLMNRNQFGNLTNVVTTYSVNGTVLTRTNRYIYSPNGVDLLAAIGPDGVTNAAYGYDNNHQVLFATNALGEVTSYTYNPNEQPTSVTQPTGLVTTNIYGSDGYLAQRIVEGYSTNSYTYTNALVYTHTDARGLTVTNTWDALGRLTNVAYPDGTSISYTYSNLDLGQVVDRMGHTNSYSYNSIRQKVSHTDALGRTTGYAYCECGGIYAITDALGQVTYFIHDNQGNLINVFYPDGYSVTNTYNSLKQLTQRADSSGAVWRYTYNNQGLTTTISNTFGQVAAYTYDIHDRLTNSVDANGVSVGMTYDNLGRLLARSYPDGGVEPFGYTPNVSGPTSYTNQIGNVVTYAYDGLGRKTNEVYVGVATNSFAYNGAGDLLALTDGKNQTTTWGYDQYGRVTNKVDASDVTNFVYQYDDDNRLTSRWSADNITTTYGYDAVGNLTNVDYSGGTSYTSPLSFTYDAMNRLTNMIDGVGTTAYRYDAAGQLLSANGPWPDDTVSYTYQNRLRQTLSLAQPNAAAWSQYYGYDTARRLSSITSPAGTFSYAYDPARQREVDELSLPNGALITNTYDSVARLLSTKLLNTGLSTLDSESYGYNLAGQRIAETNADGDFRDYTYDDMGQLVSATGKEASGTSRLQEQMGYAYDAAGNLNCRTNNALIQTFDVNNRNELTSASRTGTLTVAGTTTERGADVTSVTVNGQSATEYADGTFAAPGFTPASGSNTYTAIALDTYGRSDTNIINCYLPATNSYAYDANGNLTSDGTRNFAYDGENQLVGVWVAGSWSNSFAYDGKLRRRITKQYTWDAGNANWVETNEIHFIYDGNLVIQERDSNNLPQVTYTRGNDLSGTLQGAGGIGGLLARTCNAQALTCLPNGSAYYHADGNGNVTMLINSDQLPVAKYLYGPFGNTLSASGPLAVANTYRFSSKEWDAAAGLYYYLYRYYDPNLQRWPNRDPLDEEGFKVLQYHNNNPIWVTIMLERIGSYNLFEFGLNQPIDSFDSLGLASTGPGSLACISATEQAEAAEATYNADKTEQNLEAWTQAVMKMLAACKPPPPPPLIPPLPDPNCPVNSPPYFPPPQQSKKECFWILVGGALVYVCRILAPIAAGG